MKQKTGVLAGLHPESEIRVTRGAKLAGRLPELLSRQGRELAQVGDDGDVEKATARVGHASHRLEPCASRLQKSGFSLSQVIFQAPKRAILELCPDKP